MNASASAPSRTTVVCSSTSSSTAAKPFSVSGVLSLDVFLTLSSWRKALRSECRSSLLADTAPATDVDVDGAAADDMSGARTANEDG